MRLAAPVAIAGICVLYWPVVAAVWNKVIIPLLTPAVVGAGAYAALKQAGTARDRHEAQTRADQQRRITETYSRAVEQLASDKIEARLGGIYTLERISKESPDHYWTIMETLTAFVRERARWKKVDQYAQSEPREPPTDVAAVLTMIRRREAASHEREEEMGWRLDLRGADLQGADLEEAYLERAILAKVHLEGANLKKARLEGAELTLAHLESANLEKAHLEGANLMATRFDNAYLLGAHFQGAILVGTHFEGAYLVDATGLGTEKLIAAHGDAKTQLPADITRPARWPDAVKGWADRDKP